MLKNCLIVPVHRDKAHWFLGFLKSVFDNRTPLAPLDFDIIVATSNDEELDFFERLTAAQNTPSGIILFSVDNYIERVLSFPRLLQRYRENADGGIINIKKFAALHLVMIGQYDFAACIDCDAIAITDINGMFVKLVQNYELGMYFGTLYNEPVFVDDISAFSCSLFSDIDQIRINRITSSGQIYPWFFDVPTYRLKDIEGFFHYMVQLHESLEGWFIKLKWGAFDHIVFLYWRCLYGNSKLIDYHADLEISSIPEKLKGDELIQICRYYTYSPIWMSTKEFVDYPEAQQKFPHLRLLFHCDRFN